MHELCFLSGLTSSEWAAWVQAVASVAAIVAAAAGVYYQAYKTRLDLAQREASALQGIARMLGHLKEAAEEARAEKSKMERWPPGHPAEPYTRFSELAAVLRSFPMEAVLNEVAFEALIQARRASREVEPLISLDAKLDVDKAHQEVFHDYMNILVDQITQVRNEAARRNKGKSPMQHTVA